jgi:hypothetical protein
VPLDEEFDAGEWPRLMRWSAIALALLVGAEVKAELDHGPLNVG